MDTAARANILTTATRVTLELTKADPVTSWPLLSGNRFTPTLALVVADTDGDGPTTYYVAAQTGPYGDAMTERWWASDAATNGPHDLRHLPEWLRDALADALPDVHLPASS